MNLLPSSENLAPSPIARSLGDILDVLIAIRMDVGHSANGVAASPTLLPEQMSEVRLLLARAIASTKEVFDSILWSDGSDLMARVPASSCCATKHGRTRSESVLTDVIASTIYRNSIIAFLTASSTSCRSAGASPIMVSQRNRT